MSTTTPASPATSASARTMKMSNPAAMVDTVGEVRPEEAAPAPAHVRVPGAVPVLRLEGAATLTAAVVGYQALGAGWLFFALLFLVPDLSMLGYLAGPRVGAVTYNIGHNLVLPVLLGAVGLLTGDLAAGDVVVSALALIWVAHVGFDRMLGYGLKGPTGFGHTHLRTLPA